MPSSIVRTPAARSLWALAVCGLLGAGIAAIREKPGELPVYLRAAQQLTGGDSIYDPANDPAFSYPPAFSLVTIPLLPLSDYCRRA
ncbi:MAG: hypothetical protein AAF907_05510, partial [Planctomycetota bacterium]